VDVLETGEF